jgi:hypothetical protein
MDEIILFKNNLSFLKSVITLIVPLFLGIAKDREFHPESFFEDFNVQKSHNFLVMIQLLFH